MPLDVEYYVEHQLKQPLLRVFEPVLGLSPKKTEPPLWHKRATRKSSSVSVAVPLARKRWFQRHQQEEEEELESS
eukprot:g15729.t1